MLIKAVPKDLGATFFALTLVRTLFIKRGALPAVFTSDSSTKRCRSSLVQHSPPWRVLAMPVWARTTVTTPLSALRTRLRTARSDRKRRHGPTPRAEGRRDSGKRRVCERHVREASGEQDVGDAHELEGQAEQDVEDVSEALRRRGDLGAATTAVGSQLPCPQQLVPPAQAQHAARFPAACMRQTDSMRQTACMRQTDMHATGRHACDRQTATDRQHALTHLEM